jgi:hypothetical protein
MTPSVPVGLPCIATPLSPPNEYAQWDAIRIDEVYAPMFDRWTSTKRTIVWHDA